MGTWDRGLVRVGQLIKMQLLRQSFVICALVVGVSFSLPFLPVAEIRSVFTGELITVDANNQDINGCLIGPSGEKVCQYFNVASDGQSGTSFKGNKGPKNTGSNGNAGPIGNKGQPIDPAAETYKKQILAYQKWAEQQVKNAERQLGTA